MAQKKPAVSVVTRENKIEVSVDGIYVGAIYTARGLPPKFESVSGGTDLQAIRAVAEIMEKLWFTQVMAQG